MKRTISLIVVTALILCLFSIPASASIASGVTVFGNPQDNGSFYERIVRLDNGDLLATWMRAFPVSNNFIGGMKSFYFYRSSDDGRTWQHISTLDPSDFPGLSRDKMGMHTLYVLPQALGAFPKGTLLFAANDWDDTQPYTVHIWRSTDNGMTWQKHSDMAPRSAGVGGRVWEPEFAVSSGGQLICYYSDERQDGYDQCISYETSNDGGLTWNNYTIIMGKHVPGWIRGVTPTAWRPGMPIVRQANNGTYFLFVEHIGIMPDGSNRHGVISFKTSADGLNWGNPEDPGSLITANGTEARQCPAVAFMDDGSGNERIFVRGMGDTCSPSQCFTSTDYGQTWQLIDAPLTAVRNENVGSNWSSAFLATDNKLIELNNYFNGQYNEIRCGTAVFLGEQMIVSGADYKLVNVASGQCMDDAGGSMSWGNQMILWHDNNLKTQSWRLDNTNGGWYKLTCNFSNLVLDNQNGSTAPGSPVQQWEDNGAPAQRWQFIPEGNGIFRILNQAGGTYIDTLNQDILPGTPLVLNSGNNSMTQRWKLERIYEIARFESFNIHGTYIRHRGANTVIIDSQFTTLPLEDSQWRVVPGLADPNHISLESINMPGYYLRHFNGNVVLSTDNGTTVFKQDATWRLRPGLANASLYSLETFNFNDIYIRHFNGNIIISAANTSIERADATFHMVLQ